MGVAWMTKGISWLLPVRELHDQFSGCPNEIRTAMNKNLRRKQLNYDRLGKYWRHSSGAVITARIHKNVLQTSWFRCLAFQTAPMSSKYFLVYWHKTFVVSALSKMESKPWVLRMYFSGCSQWSWLAGMRGDTFLTVSFIFCLWTKRPLART